MGARDGDGRQPRARRRAGRPAPRPARARARPRRHLRRPGSRRSAPRARRSRSRRPATTSRSSGRRRSPPPIPRACSCRTRPGPGTRRSRAWIVEGYAYHLRRARRRAPTRGCCPSASGRSRPRRCAPCPEWASVISVEPADAACLLEVAGRGRAGRGAGPRTGRSWPGSTPVASRRPPGRCCATRWTSPSPSATTPRSPGCGRWRSSASAGASARAPSSAPPPISSPGRDDARARRRRRCRGAAPAHRRGHGPQRVGRAPRRRVTRRARRTRHVRPVSGADRRRPACSPARWPSAAMSPSCGDWMRPRPGAVDLTHPPLPVGTTPSSRRASPPGWRRRRPRARCSIAPRAVLRERQERTCEKPRERAGVPVGARTEVLARGSEALRLGEVLTDRGWGDVRS